MQIKFMVVAILLLAACSGKDADAPPTGIVPDAPPERKPDTTGYQVDHLEERRVDTPEDQVDSQGGAKKDTQRKKEEDTEEDTTEPMYCEDNSECAEGLVCRASDDWWGGAGSFDECFDEWESFDCGLCLPPGPLGAYCDETADCETGLTCGFSSNICWRHCVIPEGGPCEPTDYWDLGSPCKDGHPCYEHLDGHGTCLSAGTEGYLCPPDASVFHCAWDHVCNLDADPPVCEALSGLEGSLCGYDEHCQPGLKCDTSQDPPRCVPEE